MSLEDFRAAIESAKRLEGKAVEYNSYEGDIDIEKTIDLSPAEYVDINYQDLINEYQRSQKILSTRKLDIYAKGAPEAAQTVETAEVESRLKEMTTETLETAEQVAKTEQMVETPVIEFEKPKQDIEFERPKSSEIQFETTPVQKIEREPEKMVVKAIPPALKQEEAVDQKYGDVEEKIKEMLEGKIDELTLKKKMLELTKQLFKEKSHNRRAEIKVQITVLKNMLVSAKGTKVGGAAMIATILSTQQTEIAQQKDKIIDSYKNKVLEIKKKFYDDISNADDPQQKKEIYEKFVFSVTSMVEQLPQVISEYEGFSKKKHLAELEKAKTSCKDKKSLREVEERIEFIENQYPAEFAKIKKIIAKEIDTLIEVTGEDVFQKSDEREDLSLIVREINDMDEGTLLYYLHSHNSDYYKKYERKQIAKAEAISQAKILLAKEKGLKESAISKYFRSED
ncbi:hypothetical protein JXA56_02345 [Candidatus Micrarchaeota archaeon]|nr:hypothetical protein [Candidatus Micrarchaeota archaeon]